MARYLDEATFHPTTAGVPQGGLISPVIGNLALDGLEQVVRGKSERFRRKHNINFVRYADDFIITANNREVLDEMTPRIEAFFSERGVSLSKEKTKIAKRYFLQGQSSEWRFADPNTGTRLIKVAEVVKQQRYLKIRNAANPFDPAWDAYFEDRDKKQVLALTPVLTAKVHPK